MTAFRRFMRWRRERRWNARGSALVAVMLIGTVMLILSLTVFQFGWQDAILAKRDESQARALFLAESGLAMGLSWLKAQDAPPDSTTTMHPFGAYPQTLAGGTYTVTIEPDALNPGATRLIYTIRSTATSEGRTRILELDVSTGTVANYLYLTNREHMPGGGAPLWFCDTDVIDGPMFTNDQISIFGDPEFLDIVGSAYGGPDDAGNDPGFLYYNGDEHNHIESAAPSNAPHDNPIFHEGYELGLPQVEYPTASAVNDLEVMAAAAGITLTMGPYDIWLSRPDENGDPTYGYVSYSRKGKDEWTDIDLHGFNGIIYVHSGLTVRGTLDGEITIVSGGFVDVVDDVLYRDSDANGPSPNCDDLLGLIAGTDINIVSNEPNQTDCVIHAAMVAINNTMRVENWNTGSPRGTLTLYGSLAQDFRGPVGTGYWQDGEFIISTGYQKDYHYDTRLRNYSPPGFIEFLQSGFYTKLYWREITPGC